MKPARKRELVRWLQDTYDISQRRACRLMGLVRSSLCYKSRGPDTSALKLRMRDLAAARVRYGYRRIHVLLRREGWVLNHKNAGWVETTPRHRLDAMTPHEDYTAGECDSMFPACKGRWLEIEDKQVQWHVLTYAGSYWGKGEPRFPDEFVVGYTRHANQNDGVVTWDIPLSHTGEIPQAFIEQMQKLGA